MEDDEIRPIEDILGNLFMGGKIPVKEFKFLQVNMNSYIARKILFHQRIYTRITRWISSNNITGSVLDIFLNLEVQLLCLMNCKLKEVPLYVNTPFDDVIKYRLTHQI